MAQVDTSVRFTVAMSPSEFNLITRALRGVLKEEETEPAKDLAFTLSKLKTTQVRSMLTSISKLEDSLEMNPREIPQQ